MPQVQVSRGGCASKTKSGAAAQVSSLQGIWISCWSQASNNRGRGPIPSQFLCPWKATFSTFKNFTKAFGPGYQMRLSLNEPLQQEAIDQSLPLGPVSLQMPQT